MGAAPRHDYLYLFVMVDFQFHERLSNVNAEGSPS